ncbi:MAG: type III-A CRISPR-associated RAMP protein Csm3 [Chloroflexi bacterium]|nr:type III-A CRISPR-associated RAMP protein Csm3 [Chloroflexota bacterium]
MDQSSQSGLRFRGRVFLQGEVRAVTGLHIGGAAGALAIGGVDQPVVRNPLNDQPYLPGSSLRGKMRSLSEKFLGLPFNRQISGVRIHSCRTTDSYRACDLCQVFGVPGSERGQVDFGGPTRLLVRDIPLAPETVQQLDALETDLPYTEIKWEATIDRITSAAVPRQQERVPAGAVFAPLDLIYSVYETADVERFRLVLQALALVEDDYLGGQGSRGSGRVRFEKLTLAVRNRARYQQEARWDTSGDMRPADLLARWDTLKAWLSQQLPEA